MIQLQAMWAEDRAGLPKACNLLMPAEIPLQCDHAVIKLFVHAAQPVPMQWMLMQLEHEHVEE